MSALWNLLCVNRDGFQNQKRYEVFFFPMYLFYYIIKSKLLSGFVYKISNHYVYTNITM